MSRQNKLMKIVARISDPFRTLGCTINATKSTSFVGVVDFSVHSSGSKNARALKKALSYVIGENSVFSVMYEFTKTGTFILKAHLREEG